MKTTTLPLKYSMNRLSCRFALLFIPLALACFALSPDTRAACQDKCLTNSNTVQGDDALISTTTGHDNTALGFQSLLNDTTGFWNTAIGSLALYSHTTGFNNTAIGYKALYSTTIGIFNTATGAFALASNTTGSYNLANGPYALWSNTTGTLNTAIGLDALWLNTVGSENIAVGWEALSYNNDGDLNTAIGFGALFGNISGSKNIAIGCDAGLFLTGDSNIDIGNPGVTAEANTIRIGVEGTQTKTFIAGINGTPLGPGVEVGVNVNGQLGVRPSSVRYKEAIEPMDKASEAILALKPITFHYKHDLDPKGIPQFGLVAEDVEKVNPDLVARDDAGKPYTVRYDAVNAMLLNEFLKEHRKVEQLEKQVDALTAGLQKVSAQLEVSKSAPSAVLTSQ
jgi:hypothetical protein